MKNFIKKVIALLFVGVVGISASACSGDIEYPDWIKQALCDHVFDEQIVVNEVTCEEDGLVIKVCSDCGKQKNVTVKSPGHDWIEIDKKDATCDDAGFILYQCDVCEEQKEEILPMLPEHGELYIEYSIPATDWEDGSNSWYCSGCDQFIFEEKISAKHHDKNGDGACDVCGVKKPVPVESDEDLREGWYRLMFGRTYYLVDEQDAYIWIYSDYDYNITCCGYSINDIFEVEIGDGYIDVLIEFEEIELLIDGDDYKLYISELAYWEDVDGIYYLGEKAIDDINDDKYWTKNY